MQQQKDKNSIKNLLTFMNEFVILESTLQHIKNRKNTGISNKIKT